MENDVYVLLKPDNMDAVNPQNYHLIKAIQNIGTGALIYRDGTTVVCGCWQKKPNASVLPSQVHQFDDASMRLVLQKNRMMACRSAQSAPSASMRMAYNPLAV